MPDRAKEWHTWWEGRRPWDPASAGRQRPADNARKGLREFSTNDCVAMSKRVRFLIAARRKRMAPDLVLLPLFITGGSFQIIPYPPLTPASHWMRHASRPRTTQQRIAHWGVSANSLRPWKRKHKHNFWYAMIVKSFVCVSRLRAVCYNSPLTCAGTRRMTHPV